MSNRVLLTGAARLLEPLRALDVRRDLMQNAVGYFASRVYQIH